MSPSLCGNARALQYSLSLCLSGGLPTASCCQRTDMAAQTISTFENNPLGHLVMGKLFWVAVKEPKLSYHISDTILFPIHPYYGSLNWQLKLKALTATQFWPLLTKPSSSCSGGLRLVHVVVIISIPKAGESHLDLKNGLGLGSTPFEMGCSPS